MVSMPLCETLLARCDFPPPGTAVDIGVSGGADSSALLVLAVAAGCVVTAVHVDHGLREGSDAEAEAVAATATRFGAAFRSVRVSVADGPNLEARARAARYGALGPGALVGHTLDDRAETILLHLLRGTGPDGLAALCPPDPRRPLLRLRRAETEALCAHVGIEVFRDPSNAEDRFRRNRVRHELIPLMDDIAGRDSTPLVARLSDLVAADNRVLEVWADALDPRDAPALAVAPEAIASRALRRFLSDFHDGYPPSADEVRRVLEVARGQTRATELRGGRRLRRRNQRLWVDPEP